MTETDKTETDYLFYDPRAPRRSLDERPLLPGSAVCIAASTRLCIGIFYDSAGVPTALYLQAHVDGTVKFVADSSNAGARFSLNGHYFRCSDCGQLRCRGDCDPEPHGESP